MGKATFRLVMSMKNVYASWRTGSFVAFRSEVVAFSRSDGTAGTLWKIFRSCSRTFQYRGGNGRAPLKKWANASLTVFTSTGGLKPSALYFESHASLNASL